MSAAGPSSKISDGQRPRRPSPFQCPTCGVKMKVWKTWPKGSVLQRRRECPKCKARITTVERRVV